MRTELSTDSAVGLVEADWGGSTEQTWQTKAFAKSRGCSIVDTPDGLCPTDETGISPIRGNYWGCLFHGMIEPLLASLRPRLVLWYVFLLWLPS